MDGMDGNHRIASMSEGVRDIRWAAPMAGVNGCLGILPAMVAR